MKNHTKCVVNILTILLAVNCAYSQVSEIWDYPNFFGLRDDVPDLMHYKYYHGVETWDDYECIIADSAIIAFRRFFAGETSVAEEYIRMDNDTFLYISYRKPDHKEFIKGKVVASICCDFIDTIFTTDPYTYEQVFKLRKYWNWSKEGFWETDNDSIYEKGYYKNNRKTGEWFVRDRIKENGKYIQYDDFGNIVKVEPQNLLETKNKERILQEIYGKWRIQMRRGTPLYLIKGDRIPNQYDEGILSFDADSVSIRIQSRCGLGLKFEKFKNTWSLDDQYVLYLDLFTLKNEKYQLTYLSRHEMKLTLIE